METARTLADPEHDHKFTEEGNLGALASCEKYEPRCPKGVTYYSWHRYRKAFTNGMDFWTSEDGACTELVIVPRPNWQAVLQFQFSYIFERETFDPTRGKPSFAYSEWAAQDYFDGRNTKGRGKVWSHGVVETPYPVIVYTLKKPF